jgi:hypothetical protein
MHVKREVLCCKFFILWFHCGLCNKNGTFRVFTGFGQFERSETFGRNMTVEKSKYHAKIDIFLIDSEYIKYLEHFKIKIIPRK